MKKRKSISVAMKRQYARWSGARQAGTILTWIKTIRWRFLRSRWLLCKEVCSLYNKIKNALKAENDDFKPRWTAD